MLFSNQLIDLFKKKNHTGLHVPLNLLLEISFFFSVHNKTMHIRVLIKVACDICHK